MAGTAEKTLDKIIDLWYNIVMGDFLRKYKPKGKPSDRTRSIYTVLPTV